MLSRTVPFVVKKEAPMAPRQVCRHERARFHSVQRLGKLPPVELWHCPACKSTVSAETLGKKRRTAAAC